MDISDFAREKLVEEMGFVIDSMKKTKDPKQKNFYFSGIHGILPRLFNIDYSRDLIFLHFIFHGEYMNIETRLNLILSKDRQVGFPDDFFDRLEIILEDIRTSIIENDNDRLYGNLVEMVHHGYQLTGNGYYLKLKGKYR